MRKTGGLQILTLLPLGDKTVSPNFAETVLRRASAASMPAIRQRRAFVPARDESRFLTRPIRLGTAPLSRARAAARRAVPPSPQSPGDTGRLPVAGVFVLLLNGGHGGVARQMRRRVLVRHGLVGVSHGCRGHAVAPLRRKRRLQTPGLPL